MCIVKNAILKKRFLFDYYFIGNYCFVFLFQRLLYDSVIMVQIIQITILFYV